MDDGVSAWLARAAWFAKTVRRRRWLALAVAWLVAVAAAAGILLARERFEASARIFVDTQTVLKPMLKELAYQPDIDQQVRMLARTLISRPNVQRLLERPEILQAFDNPANKEQVVNQLVDQIRMVAAERGNLYSVTYRDTNLKRARQVVEGTVALFVSSGTDVKKRDSVDAGVFIAEQIRTNETKLIEAESRLKDFKLRNFGLTGVSNQDHFARISELDEGVSKLRSDLHAAEQARDAYRRELAAEDPRLPAEPQAPATPAPPTELEMRLQAQRTQLDDLLRRFTEEHPDVVNARRLVQRLEQERRREQDSAVREVQRSTKGTAATSPVYQKIRVALAESEASVASLKSQLSALSGRLDQARARASRVPQIEAELAQLNRDYEVIRKNYDLLIARRESASLGVRLDESSQLADFRVIEPARVSPSPVFPSRLHLSLIAVLLAAAAGVGAALTVELIFPTVADEKQLETLSGRKVLASLTLSQTAEWRQAQRRDRLRYLGVGALLLAFQAGWLGFVVVRAVNR